jgi:hypothetical protein
MADVFISYAREDREVAHRLARVLEDCGWSVFWDRRIPAGLRFDEYIDEQLRQARSVIVLWSDAALRSEWVVEEAAEARDRKILAPALIADVRPPLGFRYRQAADLVGWNGDVAHPGLALLIEDIAVLIGRPAKQPGRAAIDVGEAATRPSPAVRDPGRRSALAPRGPGPWRRIAGIIAVLGAGGMLIVVAAGGFGSRRSGRVPDGMENPDAGPDTLAVVSTATAVATSTGGVLATPSMTAAATATPSSTPSATPTLRYTAVRTMTVAVTRTPASTRTAAATAIPGSTPRATRPRPIRTLPGDPRVAGSPVARATPTGAQPAETSEGLHRRAETARHEAIRARESANAARAAAAEAAMAAKIGQMGNDREQAEQSRALAAEKRRAAEEAEREAQRKDAEARELERRAAEAASRPQ